MAISEAFSNTETGLATEWSLPRDAAYDSGQPQTADGVYQIFVGLASLSAGHNLQLRVYEKVQSGGTQRVVFQANLLGQQSPQVWVSPTLVLLHGWDVTALSVTGSSIGFGWSIRQVT